MDINKVVNYWLNGARSNWKVARSLFKIKHYDACLFYCHLTLEKILKSLVVKTTGQHAPYSHDLARLAELSKIELSPQHVEWLKEISAFNVEARYPEEQLDFYSGL